MANLTADRLTETRSGHETRSFSVPMKASAKCYQGGLVFLTGGYAHGGSPVAGDVCMGIAEVTVDNTSGSNASAYVPIRRGSAKMDNAGSSAVAQANVGEIVLAASDHEVTTSNAAAVSVGAMDELDADGGVWVFVGASVPLAATVAGYSDTVLTTSPGPTLPVAVGDVTTYDVETTATVAAVLPNGTSAGQQIEIYQSIAASTPVGTITGAFANNLNVAKTTLALGTAVGLIFKGVWTGSAWRQRDALGGTGASLS